MIKESFPFSGFFTGIFQENMSFQDAQKAVSVRAMFFIFQFQLYE